MSGVVLFWPSPPASVNVGEVLPRFPVYNDARVRTRQAAGSLPVINWYKGINHVLGYSGMQVIADDMFEWKVNGASQQPDNVRYLYSYGGRQNVDALIVSVTIRQVTKESASISVNGVPTWTNLLGPHDYATDGDPSLAPALPRAIVPAAGAETWKDLVIDTYGVRLHTIWAAMAPRSRLLLPANHGVVLEGGSPGILITDDDVAAGGFGHGTKSLLRATQQGKLDTRQHLAGNNWPEGITLTGAAYQNFFGTGIQYPVSPRRYNWGPTGDTQRSAHFSCFAWSSTPNGHIRITTPEALIAIDVGEQLQRWGFQSGPETTLLTAGVENMITIEGKNDDGGTITLRGHSMGAAD